MSGWPSSPSYDITQKALKPSSSPQIPEYWSQLLLFRVLGCHPEARESCIFSQSQVHPPFPVLLGPFILLSDRASLSSLVHCHLLSELPWLSFRRPWGSRLVWNVSLACGEVRTWAEDLLQPCRLSSSVCEHKPASTLPSTTLQDFQVCSIFYSSLQFCTQLKRSHTSYERGPAFFVGR